ncbi:MAG: PKD domain-containing protein [Acidimicrobiales bacterium]
MKSTASIAGATLVAATLAAVWSGAVAGLGPAAAGATVGQAALFEVGAATQSIAPPANVPIYVGGYGIDPPTTKVHDPIDVRAMYISNGHHAVAFVVADVQAMFAAYQEGPQYGTVALRAQAAAAMSKLGGPAISPSNIIFQGSYTHSGATLEGLWGPVPLAYLEQVQQSSVNVLVQAEEAAKPAHLQWASINAPQINDTVLNQADEYPGWVTDNQVAVLRAVDPSSGGTIATFVNVPVHPDTTDGGRLGILGDDYEGAARALLDQELGGLTIVSPETVGRQESPVQASDPNEATWFGGTIANIVTEGLTRAAWVTDSELGGTERLVDVVGTNAALLALDAAWTLPAAEQWEIADQTGEYPINRALTPPYLTGSIVGTPVTTLRIGKLIYQSEPGEPFPEIRLSLAKDTGGADEVVALSKAQDDLAYFYPAEDYPATFAYMSDHWEDNVAPQAGDQIIRGELDNIRALGFTTTPGVVPRLGPDSLVAATKPAVQLLASPTSGDVGPDGTFTTSLQAIYSPAHVNGYPLNGDVRWDFGDGTTAETNYHQNADGPGHADAYFDHAFPGPGTYTVSATGSDTNGDPVSATMAITVYPRLVADVTVAQDSNGTVTYQGSATGGDGEYLAYQWLFSDGTSGAGPVVIHEFPPGVTPGATLTVTDGSGGTAAATP